MPLTADRDTPFRKGGTYNLGVATAKKIYAGSLACMNASGYATPGAAATTLIAIGRAKDTVDNTDGADGDLKVDIDTGVFRWENSAGADEIAAADIGAVCYVVDDQTVAKTNGAGTRSRAGTIADVDATGVWVSMGPLVVAGTALLAANNLSDVSNAATALANLLTGNLTMPDNSFIKPSYAVVAAAGNDATNATVIADMVNAVTGADGTKGVALPAAATGLAILVINTDASNGLKVYPVNAGDDKVNSEAEDAAWTLGPGRAGWFIATSATQWYVDPVSAALPTTTEINVLDGLLATTAEINRAADVSTRLVDHTTANLAATLADHDGKTVLLNRAAGITVTLPAASGSGARLRFVVKATSTAYVIQVADADDTMNGQFELLDNDAAAQASYAAIGGDDTLTMNATTKGGQIGDWVEFEDIAANTWHVRGQGVVPAGSNPADPFSAAV